ncbi:lanthionine synthetase C family protein [Streptomyces gamaensis]|uniref:Lanthionine synthetase C family protein n=1 Tax=Streptomyces gamaensis TaxID=1763542 RepID=A0ABW0Z044_9ACTN
MTAQGPTPAEAADDLARQLAVPRPYPTGQGWRAQSLTKGTAGCALLHIERAHVGAGTWQDVHTWVTAAADGGISAADDSGLHFGAPALSFVLHAAQADGDHRYRTALATLDRHVTTLTHRRVDAALARMDRGDLPAFAEYDVLHGLTGIGAYLLHHAPGSDALARVLAYLVRLTDPLRTDGETLPGWWVHHDPNVKNSPGFPGGHANLGLAHGITGPLALLAAAARRHIIVDGHTEAINTICAWLDVWQQDTGTGAWWPQWITRDDLVTGQPSQRRAHRPSWCYGTPGIARAQQLAAIATNNTARQKDAERAMAECLSDPARLGSITDTGLCHGWAGLYQTAWRTAQDALTPAIGVQLSYLAEQLTCRAGQHEGLGLLEGAAGAALALHTAARDKPPVSGWDAFLLLH